MTDATQDNSTAVESTEATTTESQAAESLQLLGAATQPTETAPVEAREAPATPEEIASFVSGLSEDIRAEKSLQSFKDVDALAKSYVELNKAFGKRLQDMTEDEVATYYGKLGRPETPEGYEIAGAAEGDDISKQLAQVAFDNGISKDALHALSESYSELISEQVKMQQSQQQLSQEEQVKQIKEEFGAAFDERITLANNALKEFGGDELIQAIQQSGMGNNPALVKAFSEVGKLIAEDRPVGKQDTAKFGMTPAEASEKIAQLYKDDTFMQRWKSPTDPGHKSAVEQIESLYRIKSGQKV